MAVYTVRIIERHNWDFVLEAEDKDEARRRVQEVYQYCDPEEPATWGESIQHLEVEYRDFEIVDVERRKTDGKPV